MRPHHGAPVESISSLGERLNSLQYVPLVTSKRRMKLGFIFMFLFIMLARFSLSRVRGEVFLLGLHRK